MIKWDQIIKRSVKSLFFLTFNLIFFQTSYSQPIKSKKLPEPQFNVIGIIEFQFPKYKGEWNDTLALIQYGKSVDNWLISHQSFINEISVSNLERFPNKIDTKFFKSLNESQKLKFKEVAASLSFVIKGQKDKLMNDYFNAVTDPKSRKDFYENVTQIYFVHAENIDYLYNYIIK